MNERERNIKALLIVLCGFFALLSVMLILIGMHANNHRSIRSNERLTPTIELVERNGVTDGLYIYKLP